MILPDKYVTIQNSIFGTSALILKNIGKESITINNLWKKCKVKLNTPYTKFIQCIIFMFMTNMISYDDKKGEIYNENIKFKNI